MASFSMGADEDLLLLGLLVMVSLPVIVWGVPQYFAHGCLWRWHLKMMHPIL